MKTGNDVLIGDCVHIKRPELVTIGNRVAIDWGFYCTTQLEIRDYVHISPYVTCIGGKLALFCVLIAPREKAAHA